MSDPGVLELVRAQGTVRYALLGRALSGGDIVQLCCSGGWLTGRFEWSGEFDTPPCFFFSIELQGGRVDQRMLDLPDGALLRWPEQTVA